MICENCGVEIHYHPIFGWYHGDIKGGWNTTCRDGDADTRAEPIRDLPNNIELGGEHD
jgi:hypothetical protein